MSNKKNVLLVINSDLINAGVPNVVMTIVRNLSNDFTFDIITYHNQCGKYDDEFESYGGKIFRLSLLDYERHKIIYPLRYIQISHFLKRILRQKKYDIIHCHNGIESGIFLKHAQKFEIPIRISHAHGTYKRKGNNKILLWYHSKCKKNIMRYATTSLACAKQAGESLFMSGKFINVLNPVDITPYCDIKKKKHSGCNLLQIGYFCANKNQLFSIKLLKALLDDGMDVKLTFIGFPQEKEYYSNLLTTVETLSIKENVCFLPHDANKSYEFSNTDIVLLPSFTEGLPLVALESQSAHVAAILSDHVPADANIGLAYYAKYNDLSEWKNTVKEIFAKSNCNDEIFVNTDQIEISRWCNRIGAIYNG